MTGTRDPGNILLDNECLVHDTSDHRGDNRDQIQTSTQSSKAPDAASDGHLTGAFDKKSDRDQIVTPPLIPGSSELNAADDVQVRSSRNQTVTPPRKGTPATLSADNDIQVRSARRHEVTTPLTTRPVTPNTGRDLQVRSGRPQAGTPPRNSRPATSNAGNDSQFKINRHKTPTPPRLGSLRYGTPYAPYAVQFGSVGHQDVTPPRRGRSSTPSAANKVQVRVARNSPASLDEFSARKTESAQGHLKSARPPEGSGHSNQDKTNEVHNRSGKRRGSEHTLRESENARPWGRNNPDLQRPRSTPRSSKQQQFRCRESESQDFSMEHAFMDGFETKEQPWRRGKKVVDQFPTEYRSEYRWRPSRRLVPGTERLNSRSPQWRPSRCETPLPQKEPEIREDERPNELVHPEVDDANAMPSKLSELDWHPSKGPGKGPLSEEWLPPFRALGSQAERDPLPLLRGKSTGRRHSDEWVLPFRVVDRPYTWHRSKGPGCGPPPDQWIPPWVEHSEIFRLRRESGLNTARSGRKHIPTS